MIRHQNQSLQNNSRRDTPSPSSYLPSIHHWLMFSYLNYSISRKQKKQAFPSLSRSCTQLFLHAELICSMGRREIEMGGDAEDSALSIHPFPVPLQRGLSAQYQAGSWGLCWSLCGPSGGPLPGPSQQHVQSKGRSGALRLLCFSCLSNASSSEAMFLLKPLKELRAKRKGTHLCFCACVCAFQQLCFDVFIFHESDSH